MPVVTPTLSDIFEDAYERAGLELRHGYQLKSIRRSLNMLLLEWQNRGLNLFTIESGTIPLVAGTATYTMPVDTIDLIEHQLRTGTGSTQLDRMLTRVSVSDYAKQGNKNLTGTPSEVYINRQATEVTVTMWPIPASSNDTFLYYRLKGIDGLESGIAGNAAVPPRFVPCLTAGLAYMTAMKEKDAVGRVPTLKYDYEEQFALAAGEDQESATTYFTPWVGSI